MAAPFGERAASWRICPRLSPTRKRRDATSHDRAGPPAEPPEPSPGPESSRRRRAERLPGPSGPALRHHKHRAQAPDAPSTVKRTAPPLKRHPPGRLPSRATQPAEAPPLRDWPAANWPAQAAPARPAPPARPSGRSRTAAPSAPRSARPARTKPRQYRAETPGIGGPAPSSISTKSAPSPGTVRSTATRPPPSIARPSGVRRKAPTSSSAAVGAAPSPARLPGRIVAVNAAPSGGRAGSGVPPSSAQSVISTKAPSSTRRVLSRSMQNPAGACRRFA